MGLFLWVMVDIIHVITILLTCYFFFSLELRETKYNRLMMIGAFSFIGVIAMFLYYVDNSIAKACIYLISMVFLGCFLYKEKLYRIVVIIIWTLFALSVVDILASVLFRIIMLLLNVNGDIISNLLASIIAFALICGLGISFKKKNSTTLQKIGYGNLIGFTILLMADYFVVSAIVIGSDMYEDDARNLYLIAVIFAVIGIFIQLAAVIILYTQRNVHKEKEQILDAFLNEQKNHYEYLENREKETKKFRHDIRKHMDLIANLARNREYDKIEDYLEQINLKVDTFGNIVTVHNAIVDAIINQYYMKAMQSGVKLTVEGRFPVDCAIDTYDLCTIFSNILSNAYEAAVETEDKLVSLVCGYTERAIIIVVKNSCNSEATTGGTIWKTKKNNADYHGYGLENISDSVNKYDGIFDIEIMDNVCILKIAFNRMGTSKVETVEAGYENSNCG